MEAIKVFEKLTDACETVLKSQGSAAKVETKKMTADQFAEYAMEQIKKAEGEKSTPSIATARIRALNTSIAVAKSAFASSGLDSFDIPVFGENSVIAMADIDSRFKGLEDQVKSLSDALGKGKAKDEDDEKAKKKAEDEDDDEKAKKAKAKEDEDEKAKQFGDDDEDDEKKAKKKAEAEDDEEKAKKAKAKEEEEEAEKSADWPMDLAKSEGRSDDDKDLYDWGPDNTSAV